MMIRVMWFVVITSRKKSLAFVRSRARSQNYSRRQNIFTTRSDQLGPVCGAQFNSMDLDRRQIDIRSSNPFWLLLGL